MNVQQGEKSKYSTGKGIERPSDKIEGLVTILWILTRNEKKLTLLLKQEKMKLYDQRNISKINFNIVSIVYNQQKKINPEIYFHGKNV